MSQHGSGRVRIFLGTEPKTEIARKVLECSILRRTEMAVDFVPMIGKEWEYPTAGIRVGTGFSLRRWMIPAYCNWEGQAIYMDADQLVFSDVWDLWTKPLQTGTLGKNTIWCTYQPDKFSKVSWPQTSVMVIDCARARGQWGFEIDRVLKYLREDPTGYANFMHGTWLDQKPVKIETAWNHLNVFQEGVTKLLHYTKEPEQPWYRPEHPLARHWILELQVALGCEMVTPEMVKDALAKWNVKDDWRSTNGLHPEYAKFLPKEKKQIHRNTPSRYKKGKV
jgi:hypothetical protein